MKLQQNLKKIQTFLLKLLIFTKSNCFEQYHDVTGIYLFCQLLMIKYNFREAF